MAEQRNYRRIPFRTRVVIRTSPVPITAELADLSLRGALLRTDDRVPMENDEPTEVDIALADSELVLKFKAHPVHHHDNLYGFLFTEIDEETLAHLRRLLELNTGDAESIETEMNFWVHGNIGSRDQEV